MIEYMTKKLGDCCLSISDGDHMPPPKAEKGIPFITISDINRNNEIDFSHTMFVPNEYWDAIDNKRKPQKGDVLYTVTGSYGIPVYIAQNKEFVFQRHISILRPNPEILDGEYLYYVLKNPTMKALADKLVTGAIQKTLGLEMIRNVVIQVPTLTDQKNIVSSLKHIDEKIRANNSICPDLESMAKTLYDYWFVQFDFPDENGKPYKSSGGKMVYSEELHREIPEGWEVVSLKSIINESDKSAVQVNEAKEIGKYPFFTSGSAILAFDDYFVDGFNCFLNTGGNPDIKCYKGRCAYSTDTWCINAGDYSYMMYMYFCRIKSQFEQLFFAGSGLKHLQKDALKKQCVALPTQRVIRKFNDIMDTYWIKISEIYQENQQLASLRDFLLPMLMNGQVKVGKEA